MKRFAVVLAAFALAALLLSASAGAAFSIKSFDVTYEEKDGSDATQAGSHPYAMTSDINFSTKDDGKGKLIPDGSPKDLTVSLPPGLVGDRDAVPRCADVDFLLVDADHEFSNCPNESVVGVLRVRIPGETSGGDVGPAFNLTPPPGAAAKIGFILLHVPVALIIRVNPEPPHNLIATAKNTTDVEPLGGVELTVWGNPASEDHDAERGSCLLGGTCPVDIPEKPFLTLPRSCEGPIKTAFAANSWEDPATYSTGVSKGSLETVGCEKLKFEPTISAKPTTERAESASGLDFGLDLKDEGLLKVGAIAQSDMKQTVVTLPEGMTLNPSAAAGLQSCTPAQFARESLTSDAGEGCPGASKIGSLQAETPLLNGEVIEGDVFVAAQEENPFGTLVAVYVVIRDRELGIFVKLAGKGELDQRTGQLTTTFGEPGQEVPQFPISDLRFNFRAGPRGPLVTPPRCGSYTTATQIAPWSAPTSPLPFPSGFAITSGIDGGPCPQGTPPFNPGLLAGSMNNSAGAYSPFYLRLTRNDGEQEISRLSLTLPPGVVAKIAGMPKCSDGAIAAAKTKSGKDELASPSCAAATKVGSTIGGAGVGSELTYVPGSIYLAGPFGGAQLSIAAITPAVAGPFDAGTVVVRQAISLDSATGEAIIDGSASDPVPHILKGIPLRLRDLRVSVDRPDFTLNPTSCEPEQTRAKIFGSGADVFNPADDSTATPTSPYRATNCAALAFKPKLKLTLKGGTKRSDHPALRSVLTYPKGRGYANIGKAVVTLPPSEFIDNAHIQTPCTRVQFAANACPKGSILGTAEATTPLLDEPLKGLVYFRSNGGERLLPDVVADLKGLFRVILVGKVDSKKGRIRTTFDQVPDAPVSKFKLNLYGGKRGLLVNNRNLCARPLKAKIALTAKNGRAQNTTPVVKTSCKKQKGSKGGNAKSGKGKRGAKG